MQATRKRFESETYLALLKEPSGGRCLISIYSATRAARPLACIVSMSCSILTAWRPRSPCRLSSSLKPELADDGGCRGEGASSPLRPLLLLLSSVSATLPFFATVLAGSGRGLVGLLLPALLLPPPPPPVAASDASLAARPRPLVSSELLSELGPTCRIENSVTCQLYKGCSMMMQRSEAMKG